MRSRLTNKPDALPRQNGQLCADIIDLNVSPVKPVFARTIAAGHHRRVPYWSRNVEEGGGLREEAAPLLEQGLRLRLHARLSGRRPPGLMASCASARGASAYLAARPGDGRRRSLGLGERRPRNRRREDVVCRACGRPLRASAADRSFERSDRGRSQRSARNAPSMPSRVRWGSTRPSSGRVSHTRHRTVPSAGRGEPSLWPSHSPWMRNDATFDRSRT